ncbi:hypothetical protein I302_101519 [Kwoniella bestiolae CBS 10118]|uniref:Monopolin complex subunit Csm1/Pcs1 C-terminal domain-containing protein n=1 Tax=Kwoniella bestiolae CBS 10118 TaxID=1296100 RepID=A0A1B9GCG2_9TREE|nr:hypothetical protein I302_00203 [Kwoniella bestiolae CBS 10118]OCF28714.1 hypothetical protein I302_00203 [Kwoniella bestiolae CBS 10118]
MASASTAKGTKKVGKENAPPSRSAKKADIEEDQDGLDGGSADEDVPRKSKPLSKSQSSSKALQPNNGEEDDVKELKRKLAAVTSERDRYRSQRDTYSSQFEELTKSRTDEEGLFEKYKQKADLQAKAQNDIIATQTALTERLQAKVKSLEKALLSSSTDKEKELPSAGGPFDSSKTDPKEVKAMKDELTKLKNDNKAKDSEILELQKQVQAEVTYSKSLIEKQQLNSSTNKHPSLGSGTGLGNTEESAKDQASLALYEDLTLLNIANVKIKPARFGKEEVFNCVLSIDGKSLNFKLRCYNEIDKSDPSKPKYIKSAHYQPELLQHESEEFIKQLDYFANEFVVPRDQLGGFFMELRAKVGGEDEE